MMIEDHASGRAESAVTCTCCTTSTDRDSYERGPRLIASEKTNPITWAKSGLYSRGLARYNSRQRLEGHAPAPANSPPSSRTG